MFLVWFCFFPTTFGSGIVISVVVYDYPNDSELLGFRQHNWLVAFKNAEVAWFLLLKFVLLEINGTIHPAVHF